MSHLLLRLRRIAPIVLVTLLAGRSYAGTWSKVATKAPGPVGLILLLSDGSVMALNAGNGSNDLEASSTLWYRLRPDIHGSYIHGTWTTLAHMHDTRRFGASQVLPSGGVFIAGGEYGNGRGSAETYDPVADQWTLAPDAGQMFSDSVSEMLPDGTVMVAPVSATPSLTSIIYTGSSNSWSTGAKYLGSQDEASWLKLPDQSILTIDKGTTNSERYIPAQNKWIADASVPVQLYSAANELGAALLLADGRAFFLGATGHTAFYTPSGSTAPGVWAAGPDLPNGQGTSDAPAAMLATGNILCCVNAADDLGGEPTSFYEFDPTVSGSAAYTAEPTPTGGTDDIIPDFNVLLDLPDGNVLCSQFNNQLYVYQPTGTPVASGEPAITSVTPNGDGAYTLGGMLLDGISEGAAFGDDLQMSTNRPIVRLTDGGSNVYYARTYDWSSTDVMTGATPQTTRFTLPPGLLSGTYSVIVSANGISSNAFPFTAPATLPYAPNLTLSATGASPITLTPLDGALDAAGRTLTIVSVSTPLRGRAVTSGSSIVYTPRGNFVHFSGTDSFTYTVSDGAGALTSGTVQISDAFIPGAGNYEGLVTDDGGDASNVGYLTLRVSSSAAFTGKLVFGGLTFRIHGAFDAAGFFDGDFNTPDGANPLRISLQLDFPYGASDPDNYKIVGAVIGATDHASANAFRDERYTAAAPAPDAGLYTVLLPYTSATSSTIAAIISGTGYGSLSIGRTGLAKLTGRLADGTAFSQGGALRSGGLDTDPLTLGIFVQLPYGASGLLDGVLTFREDTGVSDASGSLAWLKAGPGIGELLRDGFSTRLAAIAARYTAPARGELPLALATGAENALVTLGEADFLNSQLVTLSRTSLSGALPDQLRLTIDPATGVFTGSFFNPGQVATEKIQGVLYQKLSEGAGFFVGPYEGGWITITPP
jgi:hypothetical protein